TEAIRLDENFAEAYYDRGVTLRRKGLFEAAITDLTRARALDPKRIGLEGELALAWQHKSRWEGWKYFDGQKDVLADPMVLCSALADVWPGLMADMRLAESEHSMAGEGWKNQVAKVRKVFNIKLFAEGGLTETETMGVFYDFWFWCEEGKKNSP